MVHHIIKLLRITFFRGTITNIIAISTDDIGKVYTKKSGAAQSMLSPDFNKHEG
jgi:hypothetical protein